MSDKNMRIMEFIRDFILDKGYSPTIGEIQKGCNISSKSVVDYHLKELEGEGQVRRNAGIARGIQVPGVRSRGYPVRILGVIAAGEPIPVPSQDNWRQEMVEVPYAFEHGKEGVYALRVRGTSMIDALVDDGDIVIMEPVSTVEDGQMVAAWLTDRE